MSEGTTKPNGSSKEMKTVEESQKKVMEKIKASGHEWFLTCMESTFSNAIELSDANNAYKNNENNSSSNNSDAANSGGDAKKVSEFVIAGANGKLSFEHMIPHIVVGAVAPLKNKRDRVHAKKGNKENSKLSSTNKDKDRDEK